jgi:cold shock CspA family protein
MLKSPPWSRRSLRSRCGVALNREPLASNHVAEDFSSSIGELKISQADGPIQRIVIFNMTLTRSEVILFRPSLDRELAGHLETLSAPARRNNQQQEKKLHFGVCTVWNRMRRFGWISSDGPIETVPPDKELFCHRSSLPKGLGELQRGDRVEFTTKPARQANKPPEAVIVRVIEVSEAA